MLCRAARRDLDRAGRLAAVPAPALEASNRAPDGFARYVDKSNSFSAAMSTAFRRRELFPTLDHVIYSFRHSLEKRMQEANIDYALRFLLMGHKHDCPKYGDGGSLSYRRDEFMMNAHPVPRDLFADFDAVRAAWREQIVSVRGRFFRPESVGARSSHQEFQTAAKNLSPNSVTIRAAVETAMMDMIGANHVNRHLGILQMRRVIDMNL